MSVSVPCHSRYTIESGGNRFPPLTRGHIPRIKMIPPLAGEIDQIISNLMDDYNRANNIWGDCARRSAGMRSLPLAATSAVAPAFGRVPTTGGFLSHMKGNFEPHEGEF